MKHTTKDRIYVISFLCIPIILLVLFSYYPLCKLVELSFSDWNGISKSYNYIGIENFREIFLTPDIFKVFGNNMAYIVVAVIQQFVGLFLAILLDSNLKGKKGFRAILFMPYIINGVAIAFMFNYMYDFDNGPINSVLNAIGLGTYAIHWLSSSYFSNFSLAFISFWKYVGFTMVIFLAALQSIPREIYEAARVDGAGFFKTIRYITFPNIKNMVQISLLLAINGSLQAYFEPFLITKGGPDGRTDTFITKSLYMAFKYNNFGKAAAMGIILLFIIIAIVIVQNKFLKDGDE
jgi:ABC-type sugar transport systems, permease components